MTGYPAAVDRSNGYPTGQAPCDVFIHRIYRDEYTVELRFTTEAVGQLPISRAFRSTTTLSNVAVPTQYSACQTRLSQ